MGAGDKKVEYLVVDTTAFIQNAPLLDVADKIITCQEVINEIQNKRQLRRLVVLPYDLQIKEAFPENIKIITDFAIKTGDYPSLTATDIKVMALAYQLEKEIVGIEHLRTEPIMQKSVKVITTKNSLPDMNPDVTGFFLPGHKSKTINSANNEREDTRIENNQNPKTDEEIKNLKEKFGLLNCNNDVGSTEKQQFDGSCENFLENKLTENDVIDAEVKISNDELDGEIDESDVLEPIEDESESASSEGEDKNDNDTDDEDGGWITPSNVNLAKRQVNSELIEERHVKVACMTTDFAMQNVLKQMNLNVAALDGRMIKQLRTFILRCYACFKTTSVMTKKFCPKCGHNTLKKVAVSLDEEGKLQIHINARRPLTARGKKFSLPRMKGGKHPNNPVLVEDHPMPQNRASKLARTKINPLDDDYIAGFSPFAVRDVTSRSAQLGIRPGREMKYWMRKNPNESRRKRK